MNKYILFLISIIFFAFGVNSTFAAYVLCNGVACQLANTAGGTAFYCGTYNRVSQIAYGMYGDVVFTFSCVKDRATWFFHDGRTGKNTGYSAIIGKNSYSQLTQPYDDGYRRLSDFQIGPLSGTNARATWFLRDSQNNTSNYYYGCLGSPGYTALSSRTACSTCNSFSALTFSGDVAKWVFTFFDGKNWISSNGSKTLTCSPPVDGLCGPAAKTYTSSETFPSGTYCSVTPPTPTPINPPAGGSTSWDCPGTYGGNIVSCTATRSPAPVNGVCGPAATYYDYASSSFNGVLCSSGVQSPVTVAFPAAGYSVNWNCNGSNGGTSTSCTATHSNSSGGGDSGVSPFGSCGLSLNTSAINFYSQLGLFHVSVNIQNNSGNNFCGTTNAVLTATAPVGRAQTLLPATPFNDNYFWNFDKSLSCINANGTNPWTSPVTPYYNCVRYDYPGLQTLIDSSVVYIAPQKPLYASSTSPYTLPVVNFDTGVTVDNIIYPTKYIAVPSLANGSSTTVEIKQSLYAKFRANVPLTDIQFRLDCPSLPASCPSFSATCTVSTSSAVVDKTVVTWTATSTGAVGTTTYSWTGDEFSTLEQVNGKTTASVSGIYSTSTPSVKHATVIVGDGTSTSTISCPGTSAGGVGDGDGVTVTDPVASCGNVSGGESLSFPGGTDACFNTTNQVMTSDPSVLATGPWTWDCVGISNTASGCNATQLNSRDSNLTCNLTMNPYSSSVSVNHGTNWVATSTNSNLTIQKTRWAVNGLGTTTENGLVLNNKIFTTIGLKTVTAELASSTPGVFGPPCTATTTVVLGGTGGVKEI